MIVTSDQKANYETKILELTRNFNSMENSRDGYRQKLYALKRDYDLDYSDLDLEQEEPAKLIPTIAEAMFPKMPQSVKEILGKEGIEEAIFKYVGDNPDKLGSWIEKFIPKKEGSASNSAPVLKESYL